MDLRAVLAILVLAATSLALLAAPAAQPASSGSFEVFVVGPTELLAQGNVTLQDADALGALLALAAAQDLQVVWDDFSGCSYDYVRGIGPYEETRSGGWNFYLHEAEGWHKPASSASCATLDTDQAVLWCWVEPDEICARSPTPT